MPTAAGRDVQQLESQKRAAAEYAVRLVRSGMVVGLGAGSTAAYAVRAIAANLEQGKFRDIVGVPCSSEVEAMADWAFRS
jgi:ribose 5-phosphate isomerase A